MAKRAMIAKYERFVEMDPYFYFILRRIHAREFHVIAHIESMVRMTRRPALPGGHTAQRRRRPYARVARAVRGVEVLSGMDAADSCCRRHFSCGITRCICVDWLTFDVQSYELIIYVNLTRRVWTHDSRCGLCSIAGKGNQSMQARTCRIRPRGSAREDETFCVGEVAVGRAGVCRQ